MHAAVDSARGRSQLWSVCLGLILLLLLAGCGGGEGPEPEAAPPEPPPVEQPRGVEDDAPGDPDPDGELRVSFLDVGQGDATLLQAADATMLIDAGRHDRDDVVSHLRARDVDEIDVVAVTHGHADHIGQLPEVLGAFPADEVWMSGTPHDTLTFERALAAIERSDAAYEEPRAGDETTVGSLDVEIVNPADLTGDLHGDSLSVRIGFGEVSFLFTGDAEAPHEAEMLARGPELLDSDVYQVGHHGSSTSTSPDFLAAVDPEIAVYSAAAGNQYGHPHAEVIERLERAGIEIYGTDVHGTVTVTTGGTELAVETGGAGRPITEPTREPRDPQPDPSPRPDPDRGGCVDINAASPRELERIIHIGPERAGQIIELRPFSSLDDLARVSGLAEVRVAEIKEEGVACV